MIRRPSRRDGAPIWLALVIAALLLAGTGNPARSQVLFLLLVLATLFVSLRVHAGPLAIVVLFAAGVTLRFAFIGAGYSDVLPVTDLAISEAFGGGNPYGHGYPNSSPPGAPFAYGPVSLLWYALAESPRVVEMAVSLALLGVLALRGRPIGLAVYAVWPVLLVTASDGSNDTSAGLFLLIALLAAVRVPIAGAALLGLAFAFKPYALAWLPPLLGFGGLIEPLIAFTITAAAGWGPAIILWGASSILTSFQLADAVHRSGYYSLIYALGPPWESLRGPFEALRYAAGALLSAASIIFTRTPAGLILWGSAIFIATLFAGFWATFAYFAAIAPVICWHLDDWLGLGDRRVRWPTDPVGRLSAWVDARWPVLREGRRMIRA